MSTNHRTIEPSHHHFMRHALNLARRNLGQTWPNPAVGAVIVKNGIIVGTGWTARGGRPHAETQALAQAGNDAKGATLYVTLEPCAHHGQTPPCAEVIITAGITHVVVACTDPHPYVNGQGIGTLKQHGIEVKEGICRNEAQALNCGFFSTVNRGRPHVAMKLATTLDGKIATAAGESKWLTSEIARSFAHYLRSQYDAIVTGIGSVLADDPLLTCRLPGAEDRSPVRIVLDRQGCIPPASKLVSTKNQVPLWVEHDTDDLEQWLKSLSQRGITRLLVEAGHRLSTAFIQQDLIDTIYWFRAPLVMGNTAMPALDTLPLIPLSDTLRWRQDALLPIGQDSLEIYTKTVI